jgi:hypothetical protein
MNYKINTLIGDIKIEKTSSLIATVGDIRAEKEADAHWVNIFINDNSDIGYSFIDQIELSEKDDIETKEELLVFTMNWYFENVQVVTEKQNKINIQKAIEYRENLEYEKAIEDLSKYTEEQLFEELEKRGLCKTRILEDKEANDYLVLEEIKELFDANSKAKIKSIKNREKENEVVLEKIKKLISFFYKNQSEIIN